MAKPAAVAAAIALMLCAAAIVLPAQAELSTSIMALAKRCAPNVAPVTLGALVAHESANNQFAVNVNGGYSLPKRPATRTEALEAIQWLKKEGLNYDIGYGQVNSSNFDNLKVTAESLLDGCNNLRASSTVLADCYSRAVQRIGEGQKALRHALSCYNTGSQTLGFKNGYVAKVVAQADTLIIPALLGDKNLSAESPEDRARAGTDEPQRRKLGTPDAFQGASGDAFSKSDPDAFQAAQESSE